MSNTPPHSSPDPSEVISPMPAMPSTPPNPPEAASVPPAASPQPPYPSYPPAAQPAAQAASQPSPTISNQPQPTPTNQPYYSYQQPYPAAPPAQKKDGLFQTLFDLSFEKYATFAYVKVIYIINLIIIWGGFIVGVIFSFVSMATAMAAAGHYGNSAAGLGVFSILLGLFGIALGFIFALMLTVALRIFLETLVAIIQIARNSKTIAENTTK